MHILLTRSLEDCSELALKFQSLGHKISHLPLLNIEKINYDKIDFSEFGGIIFTSANAVKYLDLKNVDKKIKCFCVGNVTEKKARDLGFQNTVAAEGNVSNLKELILRTYDTKNKKLIYISSETISVDLDHQLALECFVVKRIINYRAKYNQKFDEKFITKLKENIPDTTFCKRIQQQLNAERYLLRLLERCSSTSSETDL